MIFKEKNTSRHCQIDFHFFLWVGLIILSVVACTTSHEIPVRDSFSPIPGDDWKVSTPEEQGLDPDLLEEFYNNATKLDTIYSLLVIKNGSIVAEQYFNEGSSEQKAFIQSISKSYISALVGLALDQGCLTSVDQKMMEFFPEFADQITDPRKEQITIRDLLQMRPVIPGKKPMRISGQGWHRVIICPFWWDSHLPTIRETRISIQQLDFLAAGSDRSRACDTDLKAFAQESL